MFPFIRNWGERVGGGGGGFIAASIKRLVQMCEAFASCQRTSGPVLTQWLGGTQSPEHGCVHCRCLQPLDQLMAELLQEEGSCDRDRMGFERR